MAFETSTSPFHNKPIVLDRFTKTDAIEDFNPRDFWMYYHGDDIELVHVAVALLSICPSEASVERSFSLQNFVHSDRRNRLHDTTITSTMHIKMNVPILRNINVPVADDFELSDDDTTPSSPH